MTTTTYARDSIYSTDDLIAVADATGGFFFSPETMKFWNTRVLSYFRAPDGYKCEPGSRYVFITSDEIGYDTGREYSVRVMTIGVNDDRRASVDFDTIGRYESRGRAMSAADVYVAGLPVGVLV